MVDLSGFLGLSRRTPRLPTEPQARDAGRLIAFNQGLQVNACLLVDRLLGLRQAGAMHPTERGRSAPHFVVQELADTQGRVWYELDLAALASDEAFLKIDA